MSNKDDKFDDFETNDDILKAPSDFDDLAFDTDADLPFEDDNAFLENDDDDLLTARNDTSQSKINWFNIGIIATTVIGIAGISYIFIPGLMNSGSQIPVTNQQQAQIQAQPEPQQDIAPQNNAAPMGLLQNPDQILTQDDIQAIENQIVEQDSNRVFEALNAPQQIDTDSLFDAVRGQAVADLPDDAMTIPQQIPNTPVSDFEGFDTLPMPADSEIIDLEADTQDIPFDVFAQPNNQQMQAADLQAELSEIPQNLPQNTVVEMDAPAPVEPVQIDPVMDTSLPVTANTAVPTELENRLTTLETTLAAIANRLDDLAAQQSLAPIQTQPTDAAAIESLQATISRLDNQIASLNTKIENTAAQQAERPKVTPAVEPSRPEKKSAPASSPRPASTPTIRYDLRGVANGIAYVARQGTDNIQAVAVGNTVQGLGRITSIAQESGRWVVRGTSGTIRQ